MDMFDDRIRLRISSGDRLEFQAAVIFDHESRASIEDDLLREWMACEPCFLACVGNFGLVHFEPACCRIDHSQTAQF
jgi:hypothetical protein